MKIGKKSATNQQVRRILTNASCLVKQHHQRHKLKELRSSPAHAWARLSCCRVVWGFRHVSSSTTTSSSVPSFLLYDVFLFVFLSTQLDVPLLLLCIPSIFLPFVVSLVPFPFRLLVFPSSLCFPFHVPQAVFHIPHARPIFLMFPCPLFS